MTPCRSSAVRSRKRSPTPSCSWLQIMRHLSRGRSSGSTAAKLRCDHSRQANCRVELRHLETYDDMSTTEVKERDSAETDELDVIIVGAGFAGVYLLDRLRGMGMSVQVFEAGS